MAMALAVALVACSAAAGKPGEPGKDAETPKLAPFKVGTIPPMPLVVGGDAGMVDLSGYFSDPEGKALTYTASSSKMDYATVKVDNAKMTLAVVAVAAGKSTITVTATDPDKLTATQTFMVAVAPEGMRPPMLTGEYKDIMSVSLAAGGTHRVADVGQYFTEPEGEDLIITLAVDHENIATAEWVGDEVDVLITAVANGAAKVTVTATDEDDETVDLVITVTVADPEPDPEPMDCSMPLDVGDTCHESVEGAVDAAVQGNAVTVTQGTPPMWEIKAVNKGKAKVLFYDGSLDQIRVIDVEVNNRAPKPKEKMIPSAPFKLAPLGTGVTPSKIMGAVRVVSSTTAAVADSNALADRAASFANFFEDDDKDPLTYTVRSMHPQYAVVAGYKTDGSEIYVDVVNSPTSILKIDLSVTATDGDEIAGPVTVSVELPPDVLGQEYPASQSGLDVKDILVGYRPGATHMITGISFPADTLLPTAEKVASLPEIDGTDVDVGTERTLVAVSGVKAISIVVPATDDGAGRVDFTVASVGTAMVTVNEHTATAGENGADDYWKAGVSPLKFRVIVSRVREEPEEL